MGATRIKKKKSSNLFSSQWEVKVLSIWLLPYTTILDEQSDDRLTNYIKRT